mgnify:CR=1 FL=1
MPKYLQPWEAANALGVSPGQVRRLAVSRGMGIRMGHVLVLTPKELEKLKNRRRPGRPFKKPTRRRSQ